MSKAIVLLSGGQDSTTSLYWARREFGDVLALSVLYGQRHRNELNGAAHIASMAGIPHEVVDIGTLLSALGGSALVDASKPLTLEGGIPDAAMPQGLPSSFVPGRNLFFLSVAAVHAAHAGVKDLVTGVCQTDYSGYPDCRRPFIDSLEQTLTLAMPSSLGPFKIHTPLMDLTKAQTVQMAKELPGCWDALRFTVTCYEGKRPGCGVCAACVLRKKGFDDAGEQDPAEAA